MLTLEVSPPASSYSSDNDLLAFYERVLERTTAVPGIEAAGLTSRLPGAGEEQSNLTSISVEANPTARTERRATAVRQSVSPDYFNTMRIPLVEGRYFSAQDNAGAPQVALVSRPGATRFWPGEDPLGKRFKFAGTGGKSSWVTVVGVVGNVMNDRREGAPLSQVYLPYAQDPDRDMTTVARSLGSPASSVTLLRDAVQSVDRNLPLAEVRTMQQVLSLAESYFVIGLVGVFALLALLLAALGVYGVASFMATARTHEIGIRLAIGAQRGQIVRMMAWQGMVFILAGMGLGVLGAIAASRFLWSEVAGVSPADPLALSLSGVLLAGTAALGAYLPARRAAHVDPVVALRCE